MLGIWLKNILSVSVKVFLDEINILIGRLIKQVTPQKWIGITQCTMGP